MSLVVASNEEKILDYLKLIYNLEDKNKFCDEIDLTKYPVLDNFDIEGRWSNWVFKLEILFDSYFGRKEFNCPYKDKPFYEKVIIYLVNDVFGSKIFTTAIDNYSYEKHLEDVKETIRYIEEHRGITSNKIL